jgi:hypothetical protein
MSQNLISMIDALRTGKAADAQAAFSAAMSEKVNAALDAAKVQVASQIYNKVAEDVEEVAEQAEPIVEEGAAIDEAAVDAKGYKSSTGGLTQKGRDHYNHKSGGHLQAPVTTPPSKLKKGSKAANRRKSFCARMSGVKGPMKAEHGKPTRKALALKKWNC